MIARPRPLVPRRLTIIPAIVGSLFLATFTCPADTAVDALPSNLSKDLRQLIVWHRTQGRDLPATERRVRLDHALPGRSTRLQLNEDATRTVVDVRLDGSVPPATVRDALTGLGAEILARYDAPTHAGGILSARLPLDQAEAAAGCRGCILSRWSINPGAGWAKPLPRVSACSGPTRLTRWDSTARASPWA